MNTKNVVDFLTFDLSSYFRVQYIVMFILKGIPFNLREFLLATYYLQINGEIVYAKKLHDICPHIKKTTLANMLKYELVLDDGLKVSGKGGPKVKSFVVHPYYYNQIERALKECAHTIRDTNSKRRKKEQSAKDAENMGADSIDFGSIFDELE
jgi:hypothetical protein